MHHSVLDRWSRGASLLHARDPRVKFAVLLAYLVALATAPRLTPALAAAYFAAVLAAAAAGRLPVAGVIWRAAVVLPFSAVFAVSSALAGDSTRAAALLAKSYLSAAAVLVLIGTTPLPRLLAGLESLGAPRFLTLVLQFVYRYLFVISEQVQHMRLAALSRASQSGPRSVRWRAAAGAVATLFARSEARAEGIHHAMLARGFEGRLVLLGRERMGLGDLAFLAAGFAAALGLRLLP